MKGWDTLTKPTFYFWKSDFPNDDALSKEKKKYTDFGFRVVVYQEKPKEKNIHDGLKALIKNHYSAKFD